MNAKEGEIYYYDGGMLMENFTGKELNRVFDKIYFLEGVRTTPEFIKNETNVNTGTNHHNTRPEIEKQNIQIDGLSEGITIKELFSKKAEYEGKTVKIKGVVSKFNPEIMQKNWIHIQDGSEYNGEYDLTVTAQDNVQVGDTIIVIGKISLNKDFGYGYFYNIIMEEAIVKK
jgi:hypothetical protein